MDQLVEPAVMFGPAIVVLLASLFGRDGTMRAGVLMFLLTFAAAGSWYMGWQHEVDPLQCFYSFMFTGLGALIGFFIAGVVDQRKLGGGG